MSHDDRRRPLDYARPVPGRGWVAESLLTLCRAVLVVWLLVTLAMAAAEVAGVDIRENPGSRAPTRRADHVRAAIGCAALAVPAVVGLVMLRPGGHLLAG